MALFSAQIEVGWLQSEANAKENKNKMSHLNDGFRCSSDVWEVIMCLQKWQIAIIAYFWGIKRRRCACSYFDNFSFSFST